MLRFVLPVALASCVVAYLGLALHPAAAGRMVPLRCRGARAAGRCTPWKSRSPSSWRRATRRDCAATSRRSTADERLLAVLVCRPDGTTHRSRPSARRRPSRCEHQRQAEAVGRRASCSCPPARCRCRASISTRREPTPFRVVMLHDLSFVDRRQRTARDFVLVFVGISVLLLALLIVLVAWLQLRRWVERADRRHPRQALSRQRQVAARLAADPVARCARCWPRRRRSSGWRSTFARTGRRRRCRQVVREHLHSAAGDHRLEPRALHPQLRCAITSPSCRCRRAAWSRRSSPSCAPAPASGSRTARARADRDTVDRYDHIRVPPDDPSYTLRRVWLTEEQEQGYYYGFSQRGSVAAVPPGLCAAGVSRRAIGAPTRRSTPSSPTWWRRRRTPTARWCSSRIFTSRCCRS